MGWARVFPTEENSVGLGREARAGARPVAGAGGRGRGAGGRGWARRADRETFPLVLAPTDRRMGMQCS